jgi:apolipoprotein N-acyltransferase
VPDTRTFLSGALFAFAYAAGMPGYDVPAVTFVCMAPFLDLALRAPSARRAAWRGWLAGTAGSLPLYYWISHTIAVEGKLGWPLGCLAALLLSAYLGAWFSIAGAAAHRLDGRFGDRGLWAFPFLWTGLELARTYLFSGFPWMLLGYGLAGYGYLRQAADLAGVYGLSFLVVLCGTSLFLAGKALSERSFARAFFRAAPAAAAVLFLLLYGMAVSPARSRIAGAPGVLKGGIAQGGVDQSVKWEPSNQWKTLDIYEDLTRKASAAGARVVIWPETAAPFFYGWEKELSLRLEGIAAEAGVPLIFGAPWFDPADGGKFYNSVFFIDRRGVPVARYDKRRLVPFGEYIPLRRALFFLRKLTEGEEDFSPGKAPSLFPLEGAKAAASVCYEAIFPGIQRDAVRNGATVLVNVTNDAWFGDTVAPCQHLAMARLRCVELRRPMFRAANSGISAAIDSSGEILASEGLFRKGIVVAEVHPGTGMTVYAKTGDLFGISCIIISIFTLFFPLRGVHGFRTAGRENRRP